MQLHFIFIKGLQLKIRWNEVSYALITALIVIARHLFGMSSVKNQSKLNKLRIFLLPFMIWIEDRFV
jgi:hypothetical protein